MKALCIALVAMTLGGCATAPSPPPKPLTLAERQSQYREQERIRREVLTAYRAGWRPPPQPQTIIVRQDNPPPMPMDKPLSCSLGSLSSASTYSKSRALHIVQ
jgi:hypothetical protein